MEIHFKSEPQDYFDSYNFLQASSLKKSTFRFLPNVAFSIPCILFVIGIWQFIKIKADLVFINFNYAFWPLVAAFVLFLFFQFGLVRVLKNNFSVEGGMLSNKQTIRINDECLFMAYGKSKFYYSWDDILKVEESENHLYVFIDGTMAILIPKRAFENECDLKEFASSICEKIGHEYQESENPPEMKDAVKIFRFIVLILVASAVALSVYDKIG